MKNYWLQKRKEKPKCNYRTLSVREADAVDPHKEKGRGRVSRRDLSVCTGSGCPDLGAIVEHIKTTKRLDKNGNTVMPRTKETHYEPTGRNINDPDIQRRLKAPRTIKTTKIVIDLLVTGFEGDPEEIVRDLGIKSPVVTWKKGEPRYKGALLRFKENGFSLGANPQSTTFAGRVLGVLKRLHAHRNRLEEVCGKHQVELSIGAYIVRGDLPSFSLPQQAISLLGDLKGEVDLDLYFLTDATEDE